MASLKLVYFDFPARAETARLVFTYGKIPFEDYRIKREDWPTFKPTTPFGQVPILEIDGEVVAQSAAIDRYAAARAGLLPTDPAKAAKAEQWYFLLGDIGQLFRPTFALKTLEEKLAARKPIIEGPFHEKVGALDKHLEGKQYILGDELSYVDFAVFSQLCTWRSGFLDGLGAEQLDKYANLRAFRNRIASLDSVKKLYEGATANPYTAYKPE